MAFPRGIGGCRQSTRQQPPRRPCNRCRTSTRTRRTKSQPAMKPARPVSKTAKMILLDSTGEADGADIATIRNRTPQSTMPDAHGASTASNTPPVAAMEVESALLAADMARCSVRIYNAGPGTIAIGGAGWYMSRQPSRSAQAKRGTKRMRPARRIICEPGATASIKLQEIS